MLHLYSSEHCVGIVQLKLKETTFYPLIVTDLANLFHCPSDVSWGPTRRASDGRSGTQGGTCKYDMSVQFLIHHPFKQDYKTICRESIKHFLVGRFWHIKHESWIHSLRGDVVEGDSIVAQSTKALILPERLDLSMWITGNRLFLIKAKFDEIHLFVEHILQVPIRKVAWRTIYITDY